MKTKLRKVTLTQKPQLTSAITSTGGSICDLHFQEFVYTFKTSRPLDESKLVLELYEEVNEPETLKELLMDKGLTKKQLVKWVNDNYDV